MPENGRKRLDSWKEIADYLCRDVTTVQRWEKEKGLPIHRLPGGKRHPVFAYQDEIDAWYSRAENKGTTAVQPGEPETQSVVPSPAGRSGVWQKPGYILAAAFILVVTAVLAFRFAPAPELRVASDAALTSDGHDKGGGALWTDGARVYFFEPGPGGTTLSSVAVRGGGITAVPLSMSDVTIFDLSPLHSEFLAGKLRSEQEGYEVWAVPLGSSPRRIGDLLASSASWSPDGRKLAFTLHESLFISNADGSEARKIANMSGQLMWPRWSPDRKILRFTQQTYHNGTPWFSLWEIGVDGSNLHQLLNGWNDPPRECCGTWTPDGRFFVFPAERNGRTELWTLTEKQGLFGKSSGPPRRLFSGPQDYGLPAVSPDGKTIFTLGSQKRGELVRYDSRLREFVPFLGGISATGVSFSKSGKSVAYIAYPDLTVWRADADGSNKSQITFSPLEVDGLSWSPDEKWLALRARTAGHPWMVYLVPSQGGDVRLLLPSETEQGVPTWSADGKKIAFGDVPEVFGKASGNELIHILDLDTHALSELPGSEELWTARWSPDGRFLAALTIAGQRLMLYDFKKKRWRPTRAEKVDNPSWSGDDKYIYFDTEGDNRVLCRLNVADGQVSQIVSLRDYSRLAQGWSGVAPDNSPLILRNLGTAEIYSLALESH